MLTGQPLQVGLVASSSAWKIFWLVDGIHDLLGLPPFQPLPEDLHLDLPNREAAGAHGNSTWQMALQVSISGSRPRHHEAPPSLVEVANS